MLRILFLSFLNLMAFGSLAQAAEQARIDPADTGFMIIATALVLMMTLPGLALFYSGMVRKKNVLAIMAQSAAATAIVSLLWVIVAYSLSFSGDGAYLGNLSRVFLAGIGMETISPLALLFGTLTAEAASGGIVG